VAAALRAFVFGLWSVGRAPLVVGGVVLATLLATVPFALVVAGELEAALVNQPEIDLQAQEIDAEWWMEFRRHASGLVATFTPAVLGFAAPLANISDLLDATPRPWALAVPVLVYALVWAFLWGGLLTRFVRGAPIGVTAAVRASLRHLPAFIAISLAAGLALILLYVTLHPLLFSVLYERIAASANSEVTAFTARVLLYVLFAAALASVGLIADYARVLLVTRDAASVAQALRTSLHFVMRHKAAVVTLAALSLGVFVMMLAAYGIVDRRFGGWRGVLLAQAFIVARLALRLATAASQARLVSRTER
jgi:hypothetical protein